MLHTILVNLNIALEAIVANQLRALLTALGIIFGVAAVISMLAIGQGAQEEILAQIKLVGVNNIVIKPIIEPKERQEQQDSKKEKGTASPGLTLADAESIATLPHVVKVSPEILLETTLIKDGSQRPTKLVGTTRAYFEMMNFNIVRGRIFDDEQQRSGASVCIIGRGVESRFFSQESPIGKQIKCGQHWLTIIGVLENKNISEGSISSLGIRDYNQDVYTPAQTVLLRYTNRTLITRAAIQAANSQDEDLPKDNKNEKKPFNYHQLDRLTIQIDDTEYLNPTAEIIAKMLQRRHSKNVDFEITIPELLLKQQQRTKDIFNWVLGVIAGISLLVGGIGIMNIMLASVLERIKEIGLRMALGAKKIDIIWQFMLEAVLISVSGGLIGIALGVILAQVITQLAGIPTIVTLSSIILSFGVSASVGLLFGIAPARHAAQQDPINSLRYE